MFSVAKNNGQASLCNRIGLAPHPEGAIFFYRLPKDSCRVAGLDLRGGVEDEDGRGGHGRMELDPRLR